MLVTGDFAGASYFVPPILPSVSVIGIRQKNHLERSLANRGRLEKISVGKKMRLKATEQNAENVSSK